MELSEVNYKQKYLKYKAKYLELKGGMSLVRSFNKGVTAVRNKVGNAVGNAVATKHLFSNAEVFNLNELIMVNGMLFRTSKIADIYTMHYNNDNGSLVIDFRNNDGLIGAKYAQFVSTNFGKVINGFNKMLFNGANMLTEKDQTHINAIIKSNKSEDLIIQDNKLIIPELQIEEDNKIITYDKKTYDVENLEQKMKEYYTPLLKTHEIQVYERFDFDKFTRSPHKYKLVRRAIKGKTGLVKIDVYELKFDSTKFIINFRDNKSIISSVIQSGIKSNIDTIIKGFNEMLGLSLTVDEDGLHIQELIKANRSDDIYIYYDKIVLPKVAGIPEKIYPITDDIRSKMNNYYDELLKKREIEIIHK